MKPQTKNALTGWKSISMAVLCAITLGLLVGCDERVTETLVAGFNQAANGVATTLINAAFQTVTPVS
jgi:hypothetical protein